MEKKPFDGIELGGLWELAGGKGFSGMFGKAKLLVLKNNYKEAGSKQPDYRIFVVKAEPRGDKAGGTGDESF